jgi:hypothetical protein
MTAAPGWRPDELLMAGRENLDADHVRRYDATLRGPGSGSASSPAQTTGSSPDTSPVPG